MLNVPPKVISNVPKTIDTTEKIGIRIDWIDRFKGEIISKQKHNVLVQETQIIRDDLTEMKKQMEQA